MPMTLTELAKQIGAAVRGDGTLSVRGCAGLEDAGPDEVSFLSNRKYVKLLSASKAGAIIVSAADADQAGERTLLVADDSYFAFRQAVVALHGYRQHPAPGISPLAYIDSTAEVGELCTIRPFAYIAPRARIGNRCVIYPHCYVGKDAVVGDDSVLYPNVTIYDKCELGNRVTLHAGCVIGQDGFGYATHKDARGEVVHHKIPQVGNVVLEDDVEMGAGCTIDRATVGSTRIGRGTKFSDLVAIGHGTNVGRHNLFVAQVGLAGSTQTGDYVVMGGQVGVAGHLKIGAMTKLAAQSGVMTDLEGGQEYGGSPAIKLGEAKRQALAAMRLPEMQQEFRKLQKRIAALEEQLNKRSAT